MWKRQFSVEMTNPLATDAMLRVARRNSPDSLDRTRGRLDFGGQGGNAESRFLTPSPYRRNAYMRILALGGALGPVVFTVAVSVCSALRPGYSQLTQFISELGATGTNYAALMNFAGFFPGGLLIAGFGIATVWLIPRSTRSISAGSLITLFGFGIALAGIFHCDAGCPQHGASLPGTLHDRISIAAFLACIVGIGIWASHFRRIAAFRPLWKYSAASSLAGLFFLCMLASSVETRNLTGLWQRLLIGTVFVWCMVLASRLLRQGWRSAAPYIKRDLP